MQNNLQSINELIKILQSKNKLLDIFFELTNQQTDIILEEDYEKMVEKIQKKQELIEEIDKLDLMFFEKYSELKTKIDFNNINNYNSMIVSSVQELQNIIQDILIKTKEIYTVDQKNIQMGLSQKRKLQDEMKQLKQQSKVNKKYGNTQHLNVASSDMMGIFIDNKK